MSELARDALRDAPNAVALPPAAASLFRFTGAVDQLDADLPALLDRSAPDDEAVRAATAAIIARVRREGDAALLALAREYDGASLDGLRVGDARLHAALDAIDPALRRTLERAARNIERAHAAFRPCPTEVETEPGVLVGRRPDPLDTVGVYAPGGRAAYPSSVLMGVVPARVAGVRQVIVCSPPGRDGLPSPVVLAAAALAGADAVFALGGAGAIAAMAFGTASVPRVDRIVGPGNAWVAEAKLQLAGAVGIDAPAGPSELLVIADASADPRVVAREVLAQAEHDPRAAVVVVTDDELAARRIGDTIAAAIDAEPRNAIIRQALGHRGALLWARSLDGAVRFSNRWAPEHLLLAVRDPDVLLPDVRNAGTVFLGAVSSVAYGDYMTGANHVLPTAGAARAYSGLSTLDFVRWTTYQRVSPDAASHLAADVARLADAEGLPAHARTARQHRAAPQQREPDGVRTDAATAAAALADVAPRLTSPAPARLTSPAARASYSGISLYAPDRTPCAVDLSDNTNLWGVPPAAARALRAPPAPAVTRYPPLYAAELKAALAAYAEVRPDEVVTGCGSDDVLDSAIRAFGEPGDRVAYADPSFAMVPLFARMNGLEGIAVPLTADADIDPDALLATGARIVYLCSPNNPTGTPASAAAIEHVVALAPGLVILDEAYAEFMGAGWAAAAPRRERLLVVRTMSKAFGLAGLRVGWATGAPSLVAAVEKSRGPYKVSALAERAALAALREDKEWVHTRVAEVRLNRERLTMRLREMGLAPLASGANFILVPVGDAVAFARRMRAAGVAVRPFAALRGIGDALRITIGPWPMMEAALDALAEALACA